MRNKHRSQMQFPSFKPQRKPSANADHLAQPGVSPVKSLPKRAGGSTGPSRVFVSVRDLPAILEVL
jgi:hypothetical protein